MNSIKTHHRPIYRCLTVALLKGMNVRKLLTLPLFLLRKPRPQVSGLNNPSLTVGALLERCVSLSKIVGLLAVCLLVTVPALAQSGGPYELSWSTIDGGGGQSSGGQYVLTGTIGQPDADWSSGGDYELLGGFWPGGPLCFVEFDDFARFAEHWLESGPGLDADLSGNDVVDEVDLGLFVEQWLLSCPYNWPLR